ncbi:hypothetical protein [Natronococcus occultus]|uniref:DUF7988 domain-containing protein n=1 Tax=Natronococcus occultus SP4 TaxID=694430 RepID=L0JYM9_9EURY|nr:hypothetical protein [Natronococcus occultus]AGB37405.1 hypothetical protein Natoc_1600 [Natronococcus occultus SP4]
MSHPVRAARRRIQAEWQPVVHGVDDCADRVAEPWDTSRTTNPDRVVAPLGRSLEEANLLEELAALLADVVEAADCELRASPVPAPPYVTVTSRGPVLRATVDPGRLVIRLDAFEVVRDPVPAYRRLDGVEVDVSLE